MTHRDHSDHGFRVLHALRCIGTSSLERVAAAAGLTTADTGVELRRLEHSGLVTLPSGPFSGWTLTDAGRAADERMLKEEAEAMISPDVLLAGYEKFLVLNPTLLQVGTDWQMRSAGGAHVMNDHSDTEYDMAVLDRLMKVDESVQGILTELAGHLSRFDTYSSRLTAALERVMAGDHDYVSDSFDSYHIVWFQLHEDLLVTLGLSREDEHGEPQTVAG
jgi:hypothetical protein